MIRGILATLFLAGAVCAAPSLAAAQDAAAPTVRSGKYAVTLRVPSDGLYADEISELEFRVVDASEDDPVLGPPGVIRATIQAVFTMPSMPGMPKQEEVAHVEGVPGDYGVHPIFPHGGQYLMQLRVAPPGDEPFSVEFPLAVKDGDPNRPPRPKPFSVEVASKPSKPEAGEPVDLHFTIRERDKKEHVAAFDVAHERLFHLMIVRKDLGQFAHEHPEQRKDGTFDLKYTFPTEGTYHLFADIAPRGRGSQVLLATVEVKGGKAPKATAFALDPTGAPKPSVAGGMKAVLTFDRPVPEAQAQNTLTVTLTDAQTGAPVTNLQPYLGAMGHMVLVHEDGTTYVHSHPDEAKAGVGRDGVVPFLARFAKAGKYRCWAQFQRDGKVVTTDFVVVVREAA